MTDKSTTSRFHCSIVELAQALLNNCHWIFYSIFPPSSSLDLQFRSLLTETITKTLVELDITTIFNPVTNIRKFHSKSQNTFLGASYPIKLWPENEAFIRCSLQIFANLGESKFVRSLGLMGEPGSLGSSKGSIRP